MSLLCCPQDAGPALSVSWLLQDSGDSLSIASLRPQPYTFGDWLMSSCMQSGLAAEDMYRLLAASCLMLAARAGNGSADLPTPSDIERVIGIPVRPQSSHPPRIYRQP